MEDLGAEGLREEVCLIVGGVHVWDLEAHLLDHLAHEVMPAEYVLGLGVMLGVVREIARTRVVDAHLDRLAVGVAEFREEGVEVHGLLGALAGGHDLGLAARQRHATLLARSPGDGGAHVLEDEASGGVLHRPVGVGHARKRDSGIALVPEADVPSPIEVSKHALGVAVQLGRRPRHSAAEHRHGVGDVWPGLRRTVEKGTHEALILFEERGVSLISCPGECVRHVAGERLVAGDLVALGLRGLAAEVNSGELLDVARLLEAHAVAREGELDVEQVGELAFVLHPPLGLQVGGELFVK